MHIHSDCIHSSGPDLLFALTRAVVRGVGLAVGVASQHLDGHAVQTVVVTMILQACLLIQPGTAATHQLRDADLGAQWRGGA